MYGEVTTMSDMSKEEELKNRARWATDVIIQAEQHKKDKELKAYIKAELKQREKAVQDAMGKPKASPAKKVVKKKK